MMKLSVVIPVYRVEDTLERCVESVLGQRVEEMEVILVDDGSPDRCGLMCDELARRDPCIRTLHKPNGGLSDARNAGIDMATGDYITFVDSDDWLTADTYRPLLPAIGDSDILEYSIAGRPPLADRTYTDMADYWLRGQAYAHSYACNKIFRRELFDGVRYPKGRVFEDVYTLPLLLRRARRVTTTHRGYYHYTRNPHGITATADGQALTQLLEAHLRSGMPQDDTYYMYLVNIQMDVWEYTGADLLLPARQIRTATLSGHNKLKAMLLNLIGIKRLCKLNKIIHHFKSPSRS